MAGGPAHPFPPLFPRQLPLPPPGPRSTPHPRGARDGPPPGPLRCARPDRCGPLARPLPRARATRGRVPRSRCRGWAPSPGAVAEAAGPP